MKKLLRKIELNPKLQSFQENWSVLRAIKLASSVKHGGQETVVCLNTEILNDVLVQVDVVDLKVPIVSMGILV